jgi:outer membrane lipoprotein-sorting protein
MKMWAIVPMLAVLTIAARAADTLEQIEAAMKKSWEGFTSLSMDSDTKMDQASEQFSMKMDSTSATEMMKDGTKWKMRSESKSTMTQKIAGQPETTTTSNSLMVSDGAYMYSLTDSNGLKQATKMKVPPGQDYAGDGWVKTMREHYNMKVLPDESVDGVACWVIEATPKQPNQGPGTYYFAKQQGMMMKYVNKGPDGKVISTTTSKNVKVNPSIPADRFVFTAPPGVTVIDQEAMMAQQKAAIEAAQKQAAEAQKQQEAPAEKKEEPAKTEPAKSEEPAKKEEPKKEEKKKEKKVKIPGF